MSNSWIIPLAGAVVFVITAAAILLMPSRKEAAPKDPRARKAVRSERKRLPYRYADQSLFVHKDSVWTGVRLTPITDEYLSETDLDNQVIRSTQALAELALDGDEAVQVQTRLTYRPVTAQEWAAQLLDAVWDPTPNFRKYVKRIAEFLTWRGAARPETYMFIRVGHVGSEAVITASDEITARITGTADENLSPHVVARWANSAIEVQEKLRPLGAVPISREDLLWVIRKTLHGHLTPGPAEFAVTRPWGPGDFELLLPFRAENRSKHHIKIYQVNETDPTEEIGAEVTSYVTCLAAAEWPDQMAFRQDTAWLRYISNLPGHVEVSYRLRLMPPKMFKGVAQKIVNNLKDEARDMARVDRDIDETLAEQYAEASDLLRVIETEKLPGTEAQIMLMLSAPSIEELEELRRSVTNQVKADLNITLVRPPGYQWRMFESFLPGQQDELVVAPYRRLQEVETFGIALPNAGTEVGDNPQPDSTGKRVLGWRGSYIGMSGKVPVHFDLNVGPARNSGGGCAVIGASGGGKSSFALLKFYQESEAGTRCVALDPKVDFAAFCYYMAFGSQVNDADFDAEAAAGTLGTAGSKFQPTNQTFWADTQIIDVLKSGDGVLDPWQVARTIEEGELLAEAMLEMFLGKKQYERFETHIIEALQAVKIQYESAYNKAVSAGSTPEQARATVPAPTLWAVVEHIRAKHETTREIYEQGGKGVTHDALTHVETAAVLLTQLRSLPYARLAFSQTPASLGTLRRRRTVFTLRGIETPPKHLGPEQWSKPQRLAATILYVMVRLSGQMLEVAAEPNPRTGRRALRPKALFVDEAYMVTSTEAGSALLQQGLAQGRSYNVATMLIDQLASRLAQIEDSNTTEVTGNQFSSAFAFLQKTPSEANAALPLLARPGNRKVAKALQHRDVGGRLETGMCLMRDADNRVATLEVDPVFAEILAASDTNPTTRPLRQSIDPPVDVDDWTYLTDEDIAAAVEAAQDLIDTDTTHRDSNDETALTEEPNPDPAPASPIDPAHTLEAHATGSSTMEVQPR